MKYYTLIPSPLGHITVVCEDGALTHLWIPGQTGTDLTHIPRKNDEPVLMQTQTWLDRYFSGEDIPCDIPLSPKGTPFQMQVWEMLKQIPYGNITTYGNLASEFGKMSAQAVGQAVSRNPISILIPCHRVLGKERRLTGYEGGLDKKRFLLELEQIPYQE